jgi:hypothetical protein
MQGLYAHPPHRLARVHGELITHKAGYGTRYALKAVRRGRSELDQLIVLSRSKSELSLANRDR